MSRIPHSSSSRSGATTPTTPSRSRQAGAQSPVKGRTQIAARLQTPSEQKVTSQGHLSPAPQLSIKEAIALKRAETRKAQIKLTGTGLDNFESLENASPIPKAQEEEDILGRLSVRESIEQARSTGTLNLATRSLPCLPSALFEIHLGITPDPLKSVPDEPVLPPSELKNSGRRGGKRDSPAWFEAQDLQALKAWNNDITEVQHEISLFGSLKTIDMHKNKLTVLPDSFADLTALTVLDLSHNTLTSIPINLFALPELTTLNLSHNSLTSLPLNAPFADEKKLFSSQYRSTDFFTPAIVRAAAPLPRLVTLDASNNKISAAAIDSPLPTSLVKFDISSNPLGECRQLLQNLSNLQRLKELRLENTGIDDMSFPPTLFSSSPFPNLHKFDLGGTQVTVEAAAVALRGMKQELRFGYSSEDPPNGVAQIMVGKRIVKESWELDLERRTKARTQARTDFNSDWEQTPSALPSMSTAAATKKIPPQITKKPTEVIKEAWEIEAEQGLLTEGGKRRARAAAAAAAVAAPSGESVASKPADSIVSEATPSSPSTLASPQYYSQATQTLTLPPSYPPSKSPGHVRAFSLATPSTSAFSSTVPADLAVPAPTLPLSTIVLQPFSSTLRVLVLVNRRMDRSFSLPPAADGDKGFLPKLEELNLEGCNFADSVTVHHPDANSGSSTPPRLSEPILPLLTWLFPTLRTLNLCYNALTSSALTTDVLSSLILSSPNRLGLRQLRLRGNRITELDGLQGLAELFKGNRNVSEWKLEELDIRDNEIGKLPAELGFLPLDVFLVDGNTFRVPQRRVWEREGTKGLLSWLRGRVE